MPARIEFNKSKTKSIVRRYIRGEGLVPISDHYGVNPAVIRRVLTEAGVEIRGRGRVPQVG